MLEERTIDRPAARLAPFTDLLVMRGVLERYLPRLFCTPRNVTHCTVPHAYFKSFLKPSSLGKSFWPVCCELVGAIEALPQQECALIPGGVHARQLLARRERHICLDFDELVRGDPAQALANFIVDLNCRNIDPRVVQRMQVALPQAYVRHSGRGLHTGWLLWRTLVQLANKSYRVFRRQGPDLEASLARILGDIEAARNVLRATLAAAGRRPS